LVDKDEHNNPVKIPGLVLENKDQVRRFIAARRRKEIKRSYKQELEHITIPADFEQCKQLLADERCTVSS
jgi:hypothetical protein